MLSWYLEKDVFTDGHERLAKAAREAGHHVIYWDDGWWETGSIPRPPGTHAVFHGSLGNASRLASQWPVRPGAFCRSDAFCCTAWYPSAARWLLHRKWQVMPAAAFVADPEPAMERVGSDGLFFVRPDSPLKPFSGRVLSKDDLSLQALDHGFYYEDETIPVVVAPVVEVGREWRFVVVDGRVVCGSAYEAGSRQEALGPGAGPAYALASEIASELPSPEPVYVLDVCQTPEGLRLIELNPFSGADLYACDRHAIVKALGDYCQRMA